MTVREYAALRGIGYDVASRAVRTVFKQLGKTSFTGRRGIQLEESDIKLVDAFLEDEPSRRSKGQQGMGELFEAERDEWLKTWTRTAEEGAQETRLIAFTVCIVLRYVRKRGAYTRQYHPGVSVGDYLATICCRAGVERHHLGWSGFTSWLLANGYKADTRL